MNFSFTDEQLMLAESARGFLGEHAGSEQVRKAMVSDTGMDLPLWQKLSREMVWQAILIPEQAGGLGLGMVETALVMEQLGRSLAPLPLTACCQSILALRTLPDSEHCRELLAGLAQGQVVSLAHTAARPHWGAEGVAVTAVREGDSWRLNGEARFVPCGHGAETLLVVAATSPGLALFSLPADHAGLVLSKAPTLDQTRPMAAAILTDAAVSADSCLSVDWAESLAVVLDLTRIMVGADQVGCAQASLDHSIQYVSERVQFGRTIASYQAIKHKAADMMVKVECARSLMCYAACIADEWLAGAASTRELAEAAGMLASSAGDAAFFCAGTGIQLHGGVGITEEYDIQLYFKRAQATAGYLGRPHEHRETIASLLLDDGDSHAA